VPGSLSGSFLFYSCHPRQLHLPLYAEGAGCAKAVDED
jgi:hypothetical protein